MKEKMGIKLQMTENRSIGDSDSTCPESPENPFPQRQSARLTVQPHTNENSAVWGCTPVIPALEGAVEAGGWSWKPA